jgi:Spy/CpxP family protein refolding chaperone
MRLPVNFATLGTSLAIRAASIKAFINGNIQKGVFSMKTNKKMIIGLAAVLTLALAAFAYAHGGYGDGRMMGPGYGGHMMGCGPGTGYGPHMRGYDNWGNFSEEDAAKIDSAREKFFNSTRDLRRQIDEKQYAIQEELSKDTPDTGKVLELQKTLSALQSDFDQKALAHRMEVGKLVPQGATSNYYRGGYGGNCW